MGFCSTPWIIEVDIVRNVWHKIHPPSHGLLFQCISSQPGTNSAHSIPCYSRRSWCPPFCNHSFVFFSSEGFGVTGDILHPPRLSVFLKIAVVSTGYLQVTQRLPAAVQRTKTKQRWSICDVAHGRLKILLLVSSLFFLFQETVGIGRTEMLFMKE